MKEINFQRIEKKWQKKWEKAKIFQVSEKSNKKKYYVLEMYPYPSASGLHMGHAFNYIIGDIRARYMRMKGFNVLHPMGFDSFGLPAENAAIKAKSHPKIFTDKAIKNFIRQQKMLGLSYDWSRRLESHDKTYYKWNQWIFLQMYKKGLIYRKKSPVNYCRKCETVLANEQVHNGKCWRHTDTEVEIKNLEQWFIKTTAYADELLRDIEGLDWPERIKIMQKNWIGKSEGVEIMFDVNGKKWPIFTTRADTLMGVTFLVISAQHAQLMRLVTEKQKKDVEKFLKKIKSTKKEDIDQLEKEGVFSGSYALHPVSKEKIPVWIGNFVLADYGSGMVMAVPAHDQRDFEFAQKYGIEIRNVINPTREKLDLRQMSKAYTEYGVLVNSKQFDDLDSEEAIEHIVNYLKERKLGRKTINYKLRDWLVSRQRYWGTPIPMIHCDRCGIVPVMEKDLPIVLPDKVKFGKGNPLTTNKNFIEVKCPNCKGKAKRETDTMDTFFDSSWYYIRFTDAKNNKKPFDRQKTEYWMPVDFYTGGAEHATMHLIYARFFTKFLRDIKMINLDEPFNRLFNQGMLHKDGSVMSKSKGNVVLPEEVSNKYGIDAARFFLIASAAPDKDREWSDDGIEGVYKFVIKLFDYFKNVKIGKSSEKIESKINKAIEGITRDIENLNYNLASIKIRELFEYLKGKEISKDDLQSCIKLISPFMPHLAEEFWENTGMGKGFASLAEWPKAGKINENLLKQEELIDKLVEDINNILRILNSRGEKKNKVKVFAIPNEIKIYKESEEEIKKRIGLEVEVLSVKDAKQGSKIIKAKPGKPGIYLE